jgi:two-component system, chemotaxis family, chemotaxis protein CheY
MSASRSSLWSSFDKLFKNRVVLIADSHQQRRSITRAILLQIGVKTTREISDGFEAIDAICAFDPCAMILDWRVRGMDAREVVRVVRTSGIVPNPKMPIIATSDPPQKSKVIEARNLGLDQFLVRPLSPSIMRQHLFAALAKIIQLEIQPASLLNPD